MSETKEKAQTDETEVKREGIITFRIRNELFGVEMIHIREIINIEMISPLYRVDDFFVGLTNLRGQIKPVIDLGVFLNITTPRASANRHMPHLDGSGAAEKRPAIVIIYHNESLVFLVEQIDNVLWIAPEDIREVPPVVDEQLRQLVRFTVKTDTRPISVLDIEQLMAASAWERYR